MTDSDPRAAEDAASIEFATRILMARGGYTPDEAYALLMDAAQEHAMPVSELAECLVADQDIR